MDPPFYRCLGHYTRCGVKGLPSEASGYFRFGADTLYGKSAGFRETIVRRGFRIGVQDLNHDGHFWRVPPRINNYGREGSADGFRAGVLYRKQDCFDAWTLPMIYESPTWHIWIRNAVAAALLCHISLARSWNCQ
jgi:hypothetical protein